ncbi:MAG: hypothetical protein LBL13_03090 [Bacteroidales bacterium]|jgi:hypothetical protein|nr:hypothetical protein [Bacteroidales bacterium]
MNTITINILGMPVTIEPERYNNMYVACLTVNSRNDIWSHVTKLMTSRDFNNCRIKISAEIDNLSYKNCRAITIVYQLYNEKESIEDHVLEIICDGWDPRLIIDPILLKSLSQNMERNIVTDVIQLQKEVDDFNEKFKVGDYVYVDNYVCQPTGKTKIRKKAEVFFDCIEQKNIAAVWLEYVAGYVECSHVTSDPVN